MAGKGRLIEALPEEVGIEEGSEERVLEGHGAKEDADKDEDFGVRNERHGSVVVCFNPNLELLGERRGSRGTSGGSRRTRREELRHQGCPCERQSMEKREDSVRDQSNSDGFRGEPEDSEDKVLNVLIHHCLAQKRSVGLGDTKGLLANDGIAQQRANQAKFVPPCGRRSKGDSREEDLERGKKENKVSTGPKVVLSRRHWLIPLLLISLL